MTPAGWYRDPYGTPGLLRWWDGREWTPETRPEAGEPPTEGTGDPGRAAEAGAPSPDGAGAPSGDGTEDERTARTGEGTGGTDGPSDTAATAGTRAGETAAEPGADPAGSDTETIVPGTGQGGTPAAARGAGAEAGHRPAAGAEPHPGGETQGWSPSGGGQAWPSPEGAPWPPTPGPVPAGWAAPGQTPAGPPPSGRPYGAWPQPGQAPGGWPPPGQGTWQYPQPAWAGAAAPGGRNRTRTALLIGGGVAVVVVVLVVVALIASGVFGGAGATGGRSPVTATINDPRAGISYAGLGGAWHRETVSPNGGLARLGFDQGEDAVVMKNYDNGEPYVASVYSGVVPSGATGSLEVTAKALLATLEPVSYPPHTRQDLSSAAHPVDGHDGWLIKVRFDFPEAKARGWNFRSETAAMLVVDRGNGQQPAEFYVSIPDSHKKQGDLDLLLSSLKVS